MVTSIHQSIRRRLEAVERDINSEMLEEELQRVRRDLCAISDHLDSLEERIPRAEWEALRNTCYSLQLMVGPSDNSVNDDSDNDETLAQLQPKRRGRQLMDIDNTKLEALLDLNFSVSDIARKGLLGKKMHRNTIHKFLKSQGQ